VSAIAIHQPVRVATIEIAVGVISGCSCSEVGSSAFSVAVLDIPRNFSAAETVLKKH
jgi:predicted phosphoribosyltransferase